MHTFIVDYPRVGAMRELKFAIEKYFRAEISGEASCIFAARDIREAQWQIQKSTGLDFIPCNDFSPYDSVLDTAVLSGVVPERYLRLGLPPLDTYFAMARGYQGEAGDAKALAMKKWFNANYHYMAPEADDHTEIKLAGIKPFGEFIEAKAAGIQTKPVVIGAFTFLKLLRYAGKKDAEDCADATACTYAQLLSKCNELGAEWVQFDEPYLVHDLAEKDIALFEALYKKILLEKQKPRIPLQTYFEDIRDCYNRVVSLNFDGVGLDFVEGGKTLKLVDQNGFSSEKILFACVVNGKNIWRNNYENTLVLLDKLKTKGIEAVISTPCSLLHVPYTPKSETKLPHTYTAHFAFAEEKLLELAELKSLCEGNHTETGLYQVNAALFKNKPDCHDTAVQKRVAKISDRDFTKLPTFSIREEIQKKQFGMPVLPTTTIGSFPQTADVKANQAAFREGDITQAQYAEFNRKKIVECVKTQEKIGLNVLVHGEFERNDMLEYFGEQRNGYLLTENAWAQSYGTRCVKPPLVWSDISRSGPMAVAWSVSAQSLTKKPVKGMLTGPVTILNWSFPREDISWKESAYQIALAIRDEALDLETSGIRMIQIDEAALREKLPLRKSDWYSEYLDWAVPAFRLVHSGAKPQTQIHTHMCYSKFADIIKAIDDMDVGVITFEASRSNLLILDALEENNFQTEVGPGVYDAHSPWVPSVEEIKTALCKMLEKIRPERLWISPDCGLKTRGASKTIASLKNLVQAARELRNENA